MSINRNQLGRGPAIVNYRGATFFSRDDMVTRHAPVWRAVQTSMYDEVDKTKSDLVIRFPIRLWGAWENLAIIFPGYALNPAAGTSVFGVADQAFSVLGRNGDQITYANAQITKLADLYLGVDAELFAADVEITALLKNAANPEDAGAYYSVATGVAYADNAFSKANFKRVRFTGTWGANAGFTAMAGQKGFHVTWALNLKPVTVDGYGTVDMTVSGLIGTCKCIPVGPSLAQLEAAANAQGSAHGSLLSGGAAADLTLAGAGIAIGLKGAGLMEHGYAFGQEPLRIGEVMWSTTRGFVGGAPQAVATAA